MATKRSAMAVMSLEVQAISEATSVCRYRLSKPPPSATRPPLRSADMTRRCTAGKQDRH